MVAEAETFDDVYDHCADLDDVYRTIVERLVEAAAATGTVLYAVPGSPAVAERTVELLSRDSRVTVEIVPAMSFLTWRGYGWPYDPIALGVSVVDGQRFSTEGVGRSGALLVAQCDSREVLSQIKLAFDQPPCELVTVLCRLGTSDEQIFTTPWSDLDRSFEPDHLTSIYFEAAHAVDARAFVEFDELVRTLRARCPWDREQTHESLRRHLIEECYEVLDALDAVSAGSAGEGGAEAYAHLEEELGDLLFQVFFHSVIASENGQFSVVDGRSRHRHRSCARAIRRLRRRRRRIDDDVLANWEHPEEGGEEPRVGDGWHPRTLPALAVRTQGAEEGRGAGYVEDPQGSAGRGVQHVAELLFDAVALARASDVDPEDALRAAPPTPTASASRHSSACRCSSFLLVFLRCTHR
jgi:tetrapyrrole methylase family protein/MazG family protein